jgi:hypothetical protein
MTPYEVGKIKTQASLPALGYVSKIFWGIGEDSALLLVQAFGVMENFFGGFFGGVKFHFIKFSFHVGQFFVLSLQIAVAKKGFVNLLRLLFRGFEV